MSTKLERIGVLTGGGDCPGLNAVIRAVAKAAIDNGHREIIGIEDGYLGLIENRMKILTNSSVSGILNQGGTILGSCNKANPAKYLVREGDKWVAKDVRDQVVANYKAAGLDALVVIGGDGTMSGAAELVERGIRMVGVPKTIDNDLCGTDITFGHDTAVATATDALDKVHTTASSHHRVMVVELMGRYAGWLALRAGIAGGADVILIPEIPFDIDKVINKCMHRSWHGKRFTIIAAGEGAKPVGGKLFVDHIVENSPDPIRLGGIAKYLADEIEKRSGLESRSIVLGHVQRGGSPTSHDRILATKFGYHAFELMMADRFNRVVVYRDGKIDSVSLTDIAGKVRTVPLDHILIRAARAIGTSFGD